MTTRSYRFAVVGFGGRGQYHARNLEQVEGIAARCVAVADPRPSTPEEQARFGRSFYQDYRELLACEKELDCVIVASPDAEHGTHALAALERGLPVYLEKAVATTWPDAVHLYRTVVKNHYPLFVGYNLRRFPASLAMKRILDEGQLGKIQSVLGHINTGNRWSRSVYEHYTMPPFLGLVIGKLTHDTDTIQHCLGAEAATCSAIITRNIWPEKTDGVFNHCDTCSLTGLLTNGVLYTFHLTTSGPDYERRYTVNGTGGQLDVIMHTNRPGSPVASVTLWLDGKEPRAVDLPIAGGGHGGADIQIHRDFFSWLQTKPDQPYEPRSILTGMVMPIAALESASTGQVVDCQLRLRQATEGLSTS
jgi:predicted dehydrogenase